MVLAQLTIKLQKNPDKCLSPGIYEEAGRQADRQTGRQAGRQADKEHRGRLWFTEQISTQRVGTNV